MPCQPELSDTSRALSMCVMSSTRDHSKCLQNVLLDLFCYMAFPDSCHTLTLPLANGICRSVVRDLVVSAYAGDTMPGLQKLL